MTAPILIVGAGPTGLVLALFLKRHGVAFRIVDRARGPGEQSRALVVQARTLEFYRQLGLADRAVAAGTVIEAVRMREAGSEVARVPLAGIGCDMSPYPFILCLPQDEHERLLVEALAAEGVAVEWNTRATALSQDADGVAVTLAGPGGEARATFAWVAGCDGARSAVREAFGVAMAGGTYERLYYVADVRPRAPMAPELVLGLDRGAFALTLPARKGQNQRLIGFVPEGREADPGFEDVRQSAERLLGVEVAEVNWFSTYRVHHRVAATFRVGRCFLLGDAGHLHSPVGGQGMNTGIGDAVNLSWKLAQVVCGPAPERLLDTYETERIGFARALVATTDRVFQAVADTGLIGNVVRGFVMPTLFPAVTSLESGRHAAFRLLSQLGIAYPKSALSEGAAGRLAGGDRLPWLAEADNFAPLASLEWQLHLFGDPPEDFAATAKSLNLPIHRFAWSEAAKTASFEAGAAYLVRPDGYLALVTRRADGAALRAYVERWGLSFTAQ
jgi:2-polyprenyl-6-methoxyphenol hydroxylase-like FAD-dependent oxidoreductase